MPNIEWYILILENIFLFICNSNLTENPVFSFVKSAPTPNHISYFLSPLPSLLLKEDWKSYSNEGIK